MCSHLDLQRIFGRAFRRASLPIEYSNGFNPHPELSFALPLSLGFEGGSELFEVGMTRRMPEAELLSDLNACLPDGLNVTGCSFEERLPNQKKTSLTSLIHMADYEITVDSRNHKKLEGDCQAFMDKESVMTAKPPKNNMLDIRPMVYVMRSHDNIISARLACGSVNLNPRLLILSLGYDIVFVTRTALLNEEGCVCPNR